MNGDNIFIASSDGRISDVEAFLATGVSVDSQDENGYSSLHGAAAWGHVKLVEILLRKYNCNIQIVDNDGDTCLHIVSDKATCALLLEMGADKSIRNNEGRLAIETAYVEESLDVVELLETTGLQWVKYESEDGIDLEKMQYLLEESGVKITYFNDDTAN